MRVSVLTISDSVTRGEREDLSGPALVKRVRELGWEVTSALRCSDDIAGLRSQLRSLIVNLPGSPNGAVESLDAVAHLLPHAITVLNGARHD